MRERAAKRSAERQLAHRKRMSARRWRRDAYRSAWYPTIGTREHSHTRENERRRRRGDHWVFPAIRERS